MYVNAVIGYALLSSIDFNKQIQIIFKLSIRRIKMKKSRYSETLIVKILKEVEQGK